MEKFDSEEQLLEKLLEGKIIATCRGNMEMGQRSLGNRSIIADPRINSNVEKINNSIKKSVNIIKEKINNTSCNALMLGRGPLRNPFLFLTEYFLVPGKNQKKRIQGHPALIHQVLWHKDCEIYSFKYRF